jgi:inhibitor of cysteine peptidase
MKARLIALLSLVVAVALLAGSLPVVANSTAVDLNVSEVDAGRQVVLDGAHVLAVSLDSNPSTGYGWVVDGLNEKVLRQVGEEFKPESDLLGAPGKLVLRFKAVSAGQTTLNLVYRRPWENVEPEKTFSINVAAKSALVLPYKAPAVVEEPVQEVENSVNIPTSWDWCAQGYCTAIRNQGQCGSCWAFATVGVLEQALKIYNGVTNDESEQYLVSCNSEGWSCSGGWYAHDYHQWKYISGESGPGSVHESVFPYTATNAPCNPPHSHAWLINGWANLCGLSSVCTTTSIKDKIYNYGPVAVAVYVGSAFQGYTGGIFTTSQTGTVNHAVVLTGYNDTYQYFNLRNSWGTGWGESGYMRIKYGTSKVGYRTTYIW